jgi:hypothetical protein
MGVWCNKFDNYHQFSKKVLIEISMSWLFKKIPVVFKIYRIALLTANIGGSSDKKMKIWKSLSNTFQTLNNLLLMGWCLQIPRSNG